MLEQIHNIFNTVYWKILVVLVLATLLTFVHEIDVFKNGVVVYILLFVLLMLILAKEDIGFVILLCGLFILAYNNVIDRKNQVQHFYS